LAGSQYRGNGDGPGETEDWKKGKDTMASGGRTFWSRRGGGAWAGHAIIVQKKGERDSQTGKASLKKWKRTEGSWDIQKNTKASSSRKVGESARKRNEEV